MGYYGGRGDYYRGDAIDDALARAGGALARRGLGALTAAGKSLLSGYALHPVTEMKARARSMVTRTPVSTVIGGGVGEEYGRRRRMNPLNPRALRRALRRAQGFEKFARKVVRITSSGKKKVHGFKMHRKKKG